MVKKILKSLPALLLCITLLTAQAPFIGFAEGALLTVDGGTVATNTENAFISVNGGYGGISLSGDYGSESLSVALIDRKQDKFIIELNGNTLTLGYLALNMDLEVRGEGTLNVIGGIVIYAGELYLGDGARLKSDASLPVIAHGATARIRVGAGVTVTAVNAIAEIGVRYEYKDNPIVFECLPDEAGGVLGVDRFRVLYESCFDNIPVVSTARVAKFPDTATALAAIERGFISVVNPLSGADTDSTDDDSFLKGADDTVTVGKNGAVLSHANLSLDGALAVNLYFELSGLEGSVESLGELIYSGVGNGGRIPLPDKNSDGKYRFRIPISPTDMTKVITVSFSGDESGRSWEYSVEKYARYILGDTEGVFGTAIKELIASMLNYGSAIQMLNGETNGLAGDILADYPQYDSVGKISEKVSEAVEWLESSGYAYENTVYKEESDGSVRFDRMTLAVNEITAIRIYPGETFPTDGYGYRLSYNNVLENGSVYEKTETLSVERIAENGYVEITGIPAGGFHRVFRVTVTKGGEVVAYCETTVFNYVMKLYRGSDAGSAERALAEALIWYGARSVSYFGAAYERA